MKKKWKENNQYPPHTLEISKSLAKFVLEKKYFIRICTKKFVTADVLLENAKKNQEKETYLLYNH